MANEDRAPIVAVRLDLGTPRRDLEARAAAHLRLDVRIDAVDVAVLGVIAVAVMVAVVRLMRAIGALPPR